MNNIRLHSGMLTAALLLAGGSVLADLEVVVSEGGDCQTATFEGGVHSQPIGLIPGSVFNFGANWRVLNGGAYANNPSGVSVALLELPGTGEILFEEPVLEVSVFQASFGPVTLSAYDGIGGLIDSVSVPANGPPFITWDQLLVASGIRNIERVVIIGLADATLLDDLKVCGLTTPVVLKVDKLTVSPPPDGDGQAGDFLGHSVSVSGDTIIVGAEKHDHGGIDAGGAYMFVRGANGDWALQEELVGSEQNAGDRFGFSVAISNDTAVVSAVDEDSGGVSDAGAVYVFTRNPLGTWMQQQTLLPNSSDFEERFGASVDISGNTMVVGNPKDRILPDNVGVAEAGSAYVYVRDLAGVWNQQARLFPSTPNPPADDPALFGHFGDAVATDGDTLLVGTKDDDDNGFQSGSAYVYVRDATGNWTSQAKLLPDNNQEPPIVRDREQFGDSVALSGDTAVVGVPLHDGLGSDSDSGAAYVFERDISGVWSQTSKLAAFDDTGTSDSEAGAAFGESVAISGDRILIGAFADSDNGAGSGTAYLFVRDATGTWTPHQVLHASDGQPSDQFGFAAAIDGMRLVIGAKQDIRDGLFQAGSAYVYDFQSAPEELTEELIAQVVGLNLENGIESSLTRKLENALEKLEKGQVDAAINQLESFINEVEAQRGKKIAEGDANALIAQAQQIINLLNN